MAGTQIFLFLSFLLPFIGAFSFESPWRTSWHNHFMKRFGRKLLVIGYWILGISIVLESNFEEFSPKKVHSPTRFLPQNKRFP
jgi:hypothetical protein